MSKVSKAIWVLGIMCTFLLILITGQTNIKNFHKIHSSLTEIYEDRLVVKGIIFNLSSALHQKDLALALKDKDFFEKRNLSVNSQIQEEIRLFKETKLTPYEETTLTQFSKGIDDLMEIEKRLILESKKGLTDSDLFTLNAQMSLLKEDLKKLSEIQLLEGKKKVLKSNSAVESMNTFAIAENYILIIFGVLMFVVIFLVPGPTQNERLY